MYYLYVCTFKTIPNVMKIGISINIQQRVNTHQTNWGEMSDSSVYFKLPSKKDMHEIESVIKRMLRNRKEGCDELPCKDGHTEFFTISLYDYIIQFIKNWCIGSDNKQLTLIPIYLKPLEKEKDDDPKLLELAELIKTLRIQHNISQEELSNRTGISRSSIIRIESGINSSISILLRILTELGHTDWLKHLNTKIDMSALYIGSEAGIRRRASKIKGNL